MSYSPIGFDTSSLAGAFNEVEYGKRFEYTKAGFPIEHDGKLFDYLIFVGPVGQETRHAHILKTVAYVIVDETDDGYTVEKWNIKKHDRFVK